MKKASQKIVSLLLVVLIVFVLIFSVSYITLHTHHSCTGDHCPVCLTLEICQVALKTISTGIILTIFAIILGFLIEKLHWFFQNSDKKTSLYTLKVKLNN